MAAIIFGKIKEMDLLNTLDLGMAAGIAAIRSEETINQQMSVELLDTILKEKKR